MAPVSHSLDFFIGRLIAFFQFVVEFKRFHSAFKFTFGYFGHCDVVFPLKAADAYLKDSLYFAPFMNGTFSLDPDDVCSMSGSYNRSILHSYNVFFVTSFKVKCADSGHCVTEQRVCDLVKDCKDGSDESSALCSSRAANCDFEINWCGWFNFGWSDDFNWLRGSTIGTTGTGMEKVFSERPS